MDELRGLDRSKGFSLIHADLHAGNVLMEGSRVSVIDFDDTVFGWHTFDLAVALFPYVDDPRLPDFRTALITGYRDGHALPDNHDAQIDLFLVVRSLMVIGWMWARPDIQPVKRLPARIRIASRLTRTWLDDHI
jgi:Ser/Thr protein kinase RdoA (MazF antagonist)